MLRELLDAPGNEEIRERATGLLEAKSGRALKQCFELFPIIHDLIQDAPTLRRVVLQVLSDFAADNVIYLELRTTPRSSALMSPTLYLRTVLEAIDAYHQQNKDGLVCRVLVSISRHLPVEDARTSIAVMENILQETDTQLKHLIVGVELSGNPTKGKWSDFCPLFDDIRTRLKLPVSLHFGEVHNDKECYEMLKYKPERVGHAVIMSPPVWAQLLESPSVGIEVCLTSNLVTDSVKSVSEHPVITQLIPAGHSFCLCTDDAGIFETTLSEEYTRLVDATNCCKEDLKRFAYHGLLLAFCRDDELMNRLKRKILE